MFDVGVKVGDGRKVIDDAKIDQIRHSVERMGSAAKSMFVVLGHKVLYRCGAAFIWMRRLLSYIENNHTCLTFCIDAVAEHPNSTGRKTVS